jgi:hypothetical protein
MSTIFSRRNLAGVAASFVLGAIALLLVAAGKGERRHMSFPLILSMGSMSIYAEECGKMIADPQTRQVQGSL